MIKNSNTKTNGLKDKTKYKKEYKNQILKL